MTLVNILGALGIVFTSAQLLPQVVKSLRTRQVRDLSLATGVVVLLSATSWTLYGILQRDTPILIANALNLAGATSLIWLKISSQQT